MTLVFDDMDIAYRRLRVEQLLRHVEITLGNDTHDEYEYINLTTEQTRNLGLALVRLAAEIEANP